MAKTPGEANLLSSSRKFELVLLESVRAVVQVDQRDKFLYFVDAWSTLGAKAGKDSDGIEGLGTRSVLCWSFVQTQLCGVCGVNLMTNY